MAQDEADADVRVLHVRVSSVRTIGGHQLNVGERRMFHCDPMFPLDSHFELSQVRELPSAPKGRAYGRLHLYDMIGGPSDELPRIVDPSGLCGMRSEAEEATDLQRLILPGGVRLLPVRGRDSLCMARVTVIMATVDRRVRAASVGTCRISELRASSHLAALLPPKPSVVQKRDASACRVPYDYSLRPHAYMRSTSTQTSGVPQCGYGQGPNAPGGMCGRSRLMSWGLIGCGWHPTPLR